MIFEQRRRLPLECISYNECEDRSEIDPAYFFDQSPDSRLQSARHLWVPSDDYIEAPWPYEYDEMPGMVGARDYDDDTFPPDLERPQPWC